MNANAAVISKRRPQVKGYLPDKVTMVLGPLTPSPTPRSKAAPAEH